MTQEDKKALLELAKELEISEKSALILIKEVEDLFKSDNEDCDCGTCIVCEEREENEDE